MVDTTGSRFNIPAKKKQPKSKWCDGFIVASPTSEFDRVERERFDRIRNFQHKQIKNGN
jgi:hypothetical protein